MDAIAPIAHSRRPIVELLALALPTVAQMASYTVMQFIDALILSRLGSTPPTAASNSGILVFSPIAMGLGMLFLVNTMVSQNFGRGDFAKCGQFAWQGIWLGLIFGLGLVPLTLLAHPIFASFHHPEAQAAMEAKYFQITLLASPIKLVSMAIGQFSLGIDRANVLTIAAGIGVSINAFAAWCLVLGHCGFSSWGIAGAAWAQNIGVVCEMTVLALLTFTRDIRARFNVLDISLRWEEMKTLIKIGVPSGLQTFSDVLAWSLFCNLVLGLLGPAAMAANAFMFRYLVAGFMPVVGISAAVTALVGRYIGRGQPQLAARRAHLGFAVTLVYIAFCGVIYITARRPLIEVFSRDPQIVRIGGIYLVIAAIYEISDAMYLVYLGALRGAGDTLAPSVVGGVLCWSITVGGGYSVARFVPAAGYAGPWIVACAYGWVLGTFMLVRFTRGKWRKIHLLENSPPDPASDHHAPPSPAIP
jgi:MATE family multidrug resistance protein